jgi:hypothetical protein
MSRIRSQFRKWNGARNLRSRTVAIRTEPLRTRLALPADTLLD